MDEYERQKACRKIVEREVLLLATPIITDYLKREDMADELDFGYSKRNEFDLRSEFPEEATAWDRAQEQGELTNEEYVKRFEIDPDCITEEAIEQEVKYLIYDIVHEFYHEALDAIEVDDCDSFTEWLESRGEDVIDYDAEIYEYWFVSEWIADRLIEHGELVIKDFLGYYDVWGRQTTGQEILLDPVIEKIRQQIEALL